MTALTFVGRVWSLASLAVAAWLAIEALRWRAEARRQRALRAAVAAAGLVDEDADLDEPAGGWEQRWIGPGGSQ